MIITEIKLRKPENCNDFFKMSHQRITPSRVILHVAMVVKRFSRDLHSVSKRFPGSLNASSFPPAIGEGDHSFCLVSFIRRCHVLYLESML